MRLQPATVAAMFDLDRAARRELFAFAEGFEEGGKPHASGLQGVVVALHVQLVLDGRLRARRRRAEARRRRPLLLAELVLAGAMLEEALPAPLTPEAWQRAVRLGRVAQA